MQDYISREAALSSLDELEKTSYHNSVLWPDHVEECREALRAIPAADARPVTLCKDCNMYEARDYYGGGVKHICVLFKRQMQEADFCSYGEKREES